MIKSKKDVIHKVINGRIIILDDIINKNYVTEDLDCGEARALKVISEVNKYGKMKYKKDPSFFGRGCTSLKWYYEFLGLCGMFE